MSDHPVFPWLTEARRAYVYRILLMAAVIAGVYGLVDENAAAAWVGFGSAVLGNGLATGHTDTK